MKAMKLSSLIALALTLMAARGYALTFEKMVGATNAAVSIGDPAEFLCNPLGKNIYLNEKGEVWTKEKGKKRKLGGAFDGFGGSGDFIDYLECFIVGKDVVAAFRYGNGEDGGVSVRRKALTAGKQDWNIAILGLNLSPPKLSGSTLTVPVDQASVTIDIEKGVATGSDSKGCVTVSRWPKLEHVHQQFGAKCPPPSKDGSVVIHPTGNR